MHIRFIPFDNLKYNPVRNYPNDAGLDVYVQETVNLKPNEVAKIPLGFGVELPIGCMGLVLPRSSLSLKGINTLQAPIDSGYNGQIHAIVHNISGNTQLLEAGTRIAQLVVIQISTPTFTTLDPNKDRQDKGFGSSGNS